MDARVASAEGDPYGRRLVGAGRTPRTRSFATIGACVKRIRWPVTSACATATSHGVIRVSPCQCVNVAVDWFIQSGHFLMPLQKAVMTPIICPFPASYRLSWVRRVTCALTMIFT